MIGTNRHGLLRLITVLYIAIRHVQQGQGFTASARCSASVLGRWMSARALQVLSVPDVVSSEPESGVLPSALLWERERIFYGRETGDKHAVSDPRDLRKKARHHAWDATTGEPSTAALSKALAGAFKGAAGTRTQGIGTGIPL